MISRYMCWRSSEHICGYEKFCNVDGKKGENDTLYE
jgi:hypothetical protein